MTDIVTAAHAYARRGWRVVPLHYVKAPRVCSCRFGPGCATPAKHPVDNDWPDKASDSGADIQAWWDEEPRRNVGIATGAATGVFAVDVDPDNGGFAGLKTLLDENGPMPTTRTHQTGSGGLHYLFTWPDFDVRNSSKYLAPGIDVRGTGGQIVAPPSVSGKGAYVVLVDVDPVPAPEWLLERLREHSRRAEQGHHAEVRNPEPVDVERIPAEVRQLATTAVAPDTGRFRHFYSLVAACRRAGYTQGQTVTIATPWCRQVDKFVGRVPQEVARAWAKLAEEEAKQEQWMPGITGATSGSTALAPLNSIAAPAPAEVDPTRVADPSIAEPAAARTSWYPRDLAAVVSGEDDEPGPSHLVRNDGSRLFYSGKVNGLLGESESGKTWIALLAVLHALEVGENVLYLDFEDTAPGIVSRLRAMGVSDDQFGRLHYVGPEESLHLAASNDLREALEEQRPTLVVLDGFNAAMTLLGLDLDNNKDATQFAQVLLRPLAATGACVVYVDHVPKNKDNRGKGGIGAQAKRAMTTGCALSVDVLAPFGRGMTGRLKLTVDKDRPGHVRAVSKDAKAAGIAVLESDPDTKAVTVRIRPADEKTADGALVEHQMLMESISNHLYENPDKTSKDGVAKALGRNAEDVRAAMDELIDRGYVERKKVGRYTTNMLVRAYSIADELISGPQSNAVRRPSDAVPDGMAGLAVNTVQPSPPLGDGVGDGEAGSDGLAFDPNTGEVFVETR